MDYEKLGNILREGRLKSGEKQADIAFFLGISTAAVSSWERGKSRMDIETYVLLCKTYGLDPVEVLRLCNDDMPVEEDSLLPLSFAESKLITDYRNLSRDGMSYIEQQMSIARALYTEKNYASSDVEEA